MDAPPLDALLSQARGYQVSAAIFVAAKLGIADLLASGPRGGDALAEASGVHAPSLSRLLRALASEGIFTMDTAGRWGLTPLAETLRQDGLNSRRALVLAWGHPTRWEPWGNLLYSIRTGRPVFDHLYGMAHADYLAGHPDLGQLVDASAATRQARALQDRYDFAGIDLIVSVAGGPEGVLIALLLSYPAMQGVLVAAPHAMIRAQQLVRTTRLSKRCAVVSETALADLPHSAPAYLVCDALGDRDDDGAVALLATCRQGLAERGRLLVLEEVLPSDNTPSPSYLDDVARLVISGGRLRTELEIRALMQTAGFRVLEIHSAPSFAGMSILEGEPL